MFNSFIRNTLQSYNHLLHLKAQGAELSNFFYMQLPEAFACFQSEMSICLRLSRVFNLKRPFA